jgi:hypothetical protein
MKKQLFEAWTLGLRSGEHFQTVSRMFDGAGYCCLGLLCKVAGRKVASADDGDDYEGSPNRSNYEFVRELLGDYFSSTLSTANDSGATFFDIADSLEKSVKLGQLQLEP